MKPARYSIRVHGAVFCLAVLFSVLLSAFDVVKTEQIFFVAAFLFIYGEVVLGAERIFGVWANKRIAQLDLS